jgi:predicted RNA methylase
MAEKVRNDAVDDEYFCSYDEVAVHELMLKDTARLSAYRSFIESNPDQFVDKIVIDVGSGSGILALLAARAGAKHVNCILYLVNDT